MSDSDLAPPPAPAAKPAGDGDFTVSNFERAAFGFIDRAKRMEAKAKKAVTKFGISRDLLADYLAQDSATFEELAAITEEQAIDILKTRVWNPLMGDKLPHEVSSVIFDIGARRSVAEASKLVQRAIPKVESTVVKVDGKIREKSLEAIDKLVKAGKAIELGERILQERTTQWFRLFDGKFLGRDVDLPGVAFAFARGAILAKTGIKV